MCLFLKTLRIIWGDDEYFIDGHIEILTALLPTKAGSPLSINSLREDIDVAFDSIKKWLLILEQFYYVFLYGHIQRI